MHSLTRHLEGPVASDLTLETYSHRLVRLNWDANDDLQWTGWSALASCARTAMQATVKAFLLDENILFNLFVF